jgi:hypothetical protein
VEFPTTIDKQCQEIVIYMCPHLQMHKVASKGDLMLGLWFDLFRLFFANKTHAYDKPQPHPPSPCQKNVRILK